MKKNNEKNNEKNNGKNNGKNNDEQKTNSEQTGKGELKQIKKSYIELITTERANLKQFSKRKYISVKAIKQIFALLLFDQGRTMTEVMEELALSPQTLQQWRTDFKEKRMDSLFVIIEKKEDADDKADDNTDSEEINPPE